MTTTDVDTPTNTTNQAISAHDVEIFLEANPDFFAHHEDLLVNLTLPHPSGKAISLLERQVNLLRDRNQNMRKKLQEIIEAGRQNDLLYEKTRSLTTDLLQVDGFDHILLTLDEHLREDFDTEFVSFIGYQSQDHASLVDFKHIDENKLQALMNPNLKPYQSVCGQCSPDIIRMLFQANFQQIQSVAILPMSKGLIALGSQHTQRFSDDMGTLFLNYICELAAIKLNWR